MIRRALIILLTVGTLFTSVVMVASFMCRSEGILRDVIDTRDTLVVCRVHRGGAAFFISRLSLTPFSSNSDVYAQDPEVFKPVREYRRVMLFQWIMITPIFYEGSNATRFGYSIPTQTTNTRTPLPTKIGYVTFPLWFPFFLFAAYPTFVFIRGPLRRRARRKRNECILCGYNLTCNVSGVCPECGEES